MSLSSLEKMIGNKYPEIDMDIEHISKNGEYAEEWTSGDGKRKLAVRVMGGSGDWKGIWVKDMLLYSTDPYVGCEMMRVQCIKNQEQKETIWNVFVDVFEIENDKPFMNSFTYSSVSGGVKENVGRDQSSNNSVVMKSLDYLDALAYEPVRLDFELPEKIDIEETVRFFMEQLEERNFSMPVLVAAV